MDLALNFLLFGKYEYTHGIFRSVILAIIFLLHVNINFSLVLKIPIFKE